MPAPQPDLPSDLFTARLSVPQPAPVSVPPSASSRPAYSVEVRQRAIALYRKGLGAKRISRELGGVDSSTVKEWLRRYRAYGANSLQPWWRPDKHHPPRPPRLPARASDAPTAASDAPRSSARPKTARIPIHDKYREALQLYATTDLKRTEVCRRCGVSYAAFSTYLRRFHPAYIRTAPRHKRSEYQKRLLAATRKKYRKATRLYARTNLSCPEIARRTGVSPTGFCRYIRRYHRDLMLRRHDLAVSKRAARQIRLRRGGAGPLAGQP